MRQEIETINSGVVSQRQLGLSGKGVGSYPGLFLGGSSLCRCGKMGRCRCTITMIPEVDNLIFTDTTWPNTKLRKSWIVQWKTVPEEEE